MLLFGLDTQASFDRALAAELGVPLAAHEARAFEDGEYKLRPLADPLSLIHISEPTRPIG